MLSCKGCERVFEVTEEDLGFYEKIRVPVPSLCPSCRQKRRFAWRNERGLKSRECDLCKKAVISIYGKGAKFPVYCNGCWWGDEWDGLSFGRDYKEGVSFFEQMKELRNEVPRLALYLKNAVNSEYCNHAEGLKDCYLCVDTIGSEGAYYCALLDDCRDVADCRHLWSSELCYEVQYGRNNYNCVESFLVEGCRDSAFLYDCRDLQDSFLCWNKRRGRYLVFNEQKSKEEYEELMKRVDLSSYENYQFWKKEFRKVVEAYAVKRGQVQKKSEDSGGNFLDECKNVKESFIISKGRDCKYCYLNWDIKDCYDTTESAFECEMQYESHGCNRGTRVIGGHISYDVDEVCYVDSCHNSSELFGCIGLKRKRYCILNKEYSKEDYLALKGKIVEEMKRLGEWGEFFPAEHAPFKYEDSVASEYFGERKKGREVLKSRLKDRLEDCEEFVGEALECVECGGFYKVIKEEMGFYRKMNLCLPRKCFKCRHEERMKLCPSFEMEMQSCSKCQKEILSGTKGNVYCEECYLGVVG